MDEFSSEGYKRDRSKFTGYLGRVLGKNPRPLIFSGKKSSPPFFSWKKSLPPNIFFRKTTIDYFLIFKNGFFEKWSIGFSNFTVKKIFAPLIFFEKKVCAPLSIVPARVPDKFWPVPNSSQDCSLKEDLSLTTYWTIDNLLLLWD